VLASAEDIERVHQLKGAGRSIREIAKETGLSKSQVGRLLAPTAVARAG
jgi:hypothetical protein